MLTYLEKDAKCQTFFPPSAASDKIITKLFTFLPKVTT
jgi:hypothetical protein